MKLPCIVYKSIANIEYMDRYVFMWSAKLQEQIYVNCFTFYKARYFHYVFVFSFFKTRWPTNLNMDWLHVSPFVLWRVIFDVILDDSYPDYFLPSSVKEAPPPSLPVLHTESCVSCPRRILFRFYNQVEDSDAPFFQSGWPVTYEFALRMRSPEKWRVRK